MEKQWLKKVRQEFTLATKDLYMQQWQLYIKYRKAKKNRQHGLYYMFMKQLRQDADKI